MIRLLQMTSSHLAVFVTLLTEILTSICQFLALFVIAVGVCKALSIFLRKSLFKPHTPTAFQMSRLEMGYSFSLGLSYLVGATILKTILSSQWLDIARLGIIIGVRTILNLLLERAISRTVSGEDVVEYSDRDTILHTSAYPTPEEPRPPVVLG